MMQQLPPVNLAHGPKSSSSSRTCNTTAEPQAAVSVHSNSIASAASLSSTSIRNIANPACNTDTVHELPDNTNQAHQRNPNLKSTHIHRSEVRTDLDTLPYPTKNTEDSSTPTVVNRGPGNISVHSSVNINHTSNSSTSTSSNICTQNTKEHKHHHRPIVDTTASTITSTPPNRMGSATTAVNMNMSPSSCSKQPLTVSTAVSFATPDTAEQRKVVGQVQVDRPGGPCHRMTFMDENMNMNCPTSNGSAAATIVSVRENEVNEEQVEVETTVAQSKEPLLKAPLNISGSIISAPTAKTTNMATVTPSTPASLSHKKSQASSVAMTTTTSSATTSSTLPQHSAVHVKQETKEAALKSAGSSYNTSGNQSDMNIVSNVTASATRTKDSLTKREVVAPQRATAPTHQNVKKEPTGISVTMVNTKTESNQNNLQAVKSSTGGSVRLSAPASVLPSGSSAVSISNVGAKAGSKINQSSRANNMQMKEKQITQTTAASVKSASASVPAQGSIQSKNQSQSSQPRSMTPVPPPSTHNTAKATRTPVRSPHPSMSSSSIVHNAHAMASDLFGSPGNSIFLSPAPGGGTKNQSLGGIGMTPTNFATDFGRTDLSTHSLDANNVLPWLSPKAYELFSPGTAGITPGGGMTAGITPGNQSSNSNRLHLSMPVNKLLAENNALSLPFEGNASSAHDAMVGRENVDNGIGKKQTLGSVLGKNTKGGTMRTSATTSSMSMGRQVSRGSAAGICVSPLARKTSKMRENTETDSETPINFNDVFASPKVDVRGSGMGYMNINIHMGEHEIPHISDGRQTQALEKDLAERDDMEDEDLNVLLKLAETTPRRNGAEGKTHTRMFRGGNGTFAYPAVEPLYAVESHSGTVHNHGPPSSLHLPIIGKRSPPPGGSSGAGPLPKSLLQRPISSGSGGGRHTLSPKKRKSISQSPGTATTPGSVASANSGPGYHASVSHHHIPHRPPPQGYYHPPYMGHHPHGHPMAVGHGHPPYPPYSYPPHGQGAHGHPPPPHAPYMYPSTLPSGPESTKDHKKKTGTKTASSKASIKGGVTGTSKSSKRPLSSSGSSSGAATKKSRKGGARGRGPGKKKAPASSAHHAASMNPVDKQKAAATISAINNKSGKKNDRAATLAAAVLRGVTMRPSGKWQAQLYFAGKSRYIGVFDSREKAALAYEIAREHLQHKTASGGKDTEAHVNAARKAAFEGVNENDPRAS